MLRKKKRKGNNNVHWKRAVALLFLSVTSKEEEFWDNIGRERDKMIV